MKMFSSGAGGYNTFVQVLRTGDAATYVFPRVDGWRMQLCEVRCISYTSLVVHVIFTALVYRVLMLRIVKVFINKDIWNVIFRYQCMA